MLLTITTTHRPATDLGYLLHKNPARLHTAQLSVGEAHVFYPEANDERCTAAVLLEVDPISLVRGKGGEGGRVDEYVNDRPYAASSMLSSAILEFFSTAMGGRSKDRPELAQTPIPLCAEVPVPPVRGGEAFVRSLFEPLGYQVTIERLPLDPEFPEWGEAPYYRLVLDQTVRLAELLNHLYVLIPVLDARKHYYIGQDEVEKLLRMSNSLRVLDLGCGDGKLLSLLMDEPQFSEVVGMDVSLVALQRARRRLNVDRMPERKASRLKLIHGSLVNRDRRLEGFDAAAIVEVVEHLDEFRLASMERVVFEFARPRTVVLTTPNREYNVLFDSLPEGRLRHSDHRFEWTRAEFEAWANGVAERHGYAVAISGVGPENEAYGAPSQMAVFTR